MIFLKVTYDIVPRSREILQTFVWSGVTNLPPTRYNRLQIFAALQSYIFPHFRPVTFKLGKFTNIKTPFPVVSKDFP